MTAYIPAAARAALAVAAWALVAPTPTLAMDKNTIIQALQPKYAKTRGLTIQGEEPDPPSIDLQLQFDYNADTLTEESLTTLRALAEALRDESLATMRFSVIGHTDASGSKRYNLDLSNRRATSVVRHLTKAHRIAETRLAASGEERLVDPKNPRADVNRRVEIRTVLP